MTLATPSTSQKALQLNLDATAYGAIAEIGGGQEVARWFFSVGGAAGTVAKTISAYDMAVSDSLYGTSPRYVSRQRLEAMLEHEFAQTVACLGTGLGDKKRFFAFADTVATRSFRHAGSGRGWVGVRFQAQPREEPSEIIVHAHMFDITATRQQETLGVLGVNLIHGAIYRSANPAGLIASLMDDLSRDRLEIDMIKLSGPAFPGVDNRLMSLQLVESGLTDAAMFTASGEVVQPSEVLYKKPILVQRGDFRPVTRRTHDLLNRAMDQFLNEPGVRASKPIALAEMTLRGLGPQPDLSHADFLARADLLKALGVDVLISRFGHDDQLVEYLSAYTEGLIGLAVELPDFQQLLDEGAFADLPGGVLESVGRLFKRSVKMYVYPTRDQGSDRVQTLEQLHVAPPWHHLHALLLDTGRVEPIRSYDASCLSISESEALTRLQGGDASWEEMVPTTVAEIIKAEGLFGWQSAR